MCLDISTKKKEKIGIETKQDSAIHWMERDMSTGVIYNRAHLLVSVVISIGPNTVDVLVIMVSSGIHRSV